MIASQHAQARRGLAARWAAGMAKPGERLGRLEHSLLELIDGIVADLLAGDPELAGVISAGASLVTMGCTRPDDLPCAVEVLGAELLTLPELRSIPDARSRVMAALGRFAGGYATALVSLTLDRAGQSEARLREVFTGSAVGIAITDADGGLVRTNLALAEILGRDEGDLAAGNLYELLDPGSSEHLRAAYREVSGGRVDRIRLERALTREDGELAWVYLAVSALRDDAGTVTHLVTMVEDITELHLMQVQLNNQALHDVLTGLPNRQAFTLRVESTLGQLDPAAQVTLLQLDLDGFSMINDWLGVETGDWLLKLVARRLVDAFAQERAVVARIASDEFAILVENAPTTPAAATLAARINEELSEPAYRDGLGLALSACIGVVQRRAGGVDHIELLRQADATLRRARSKGKRQWAMADGRLDAADRGRFLAAAGMPGELENGRFRLAYQPLVRLAGPAGQAGVSVLLQWDHPDRGPLGHDDIVRLAEHAGMVPPIYEWLLATACRQAVAWLERFGEPAPALTVNLPPAQAGDPDLVAAVNRALGDAGLPAARLGLSLPASTLSSAALSKEGTDAEDNLQVLAEMGIPVSIHGFGTGHGGLALLEDLPVKSVWMAGWLVRRIAERPGSITGRAVAGLVPLVHAAGVTATVGGIDTAEQATWWRAAGADVGCGALFAGPASPQELAARLG